MITVFKQASEATEKYDYVVCAHKALELSAAVPHALENAVGPDTTMAIIQNGVGNEDPFREKYPTNTIISCVTWVGAVQSEPGIINHTQAENAEIGLFPNAGSNATVENARLNEFASLLRTGGTTFTVEDDVQIKRWEKVVWNAAWNPLTTLTMLDTQTWLKSSDAAMPFTRQLMREVIDVARKCGVPLEYSLIDTLINKILALPGIGSSMQTDAKEGKNHIALLNHRNMLTAS